MLPTNKTAPKKSLSEFSLLVYGPGKIGKSTWCAGAENALFLATEPGLNSIEAYQVPIRNWGDFLDAGAEIARGSHEFSTIVIDTIDLAYKMCAEHTCKKAGVDHESDLSYGKGFALVNNEFQRVLTKLAQLPYGIVLISHSQEKEIETRTGKKTRIVPTLPEKARQMVTGLVDIMLYCDLEYCQDETTQKEVCRRVMRTRPSDLYDAGDRTGRLPETVPLNYRYFIEAFENQAKGIKK